MPRLPNTLLNKRHTANLFNVCTKMEHPKSRHCKTVGAHYRDFYDPPSELTQPHFWHTPVTNKIPNLPRLKEMDCEPYHLMGRV